MDRLASLVASIWRARQAAAPLGLGETRIVGTIKIHRFRDSYTVTDLTNAGKRGKQVREISMSPGYGGWPSERRERWLESMAKVLPEISSMDEMDSFIRNDFPPEVKVETTSRRGIDVLPATIAVFKNLDLNEGIHITTISPHEFLMSDTQKIGESPQGGAVNDNDLKGGFEHTTLYYSRDKKSAAVFHAWFSENQAKAKQMTILDFRKLWDQLGVKWDSH